jgi:peptide chain release factor
VSPVDPPVHLLVSAGRGPEECCWAVAELVARLEAEAAAGKVAVRRLETVPGEHRGTFRSVLLRLTGDAAEVVAGAWTGTLCWQASSPYRAAGRKNWYVTTVRCELEPPRRDFVEADVEIVPCRTGGPGGQHRNKVSTAVRATHRPTGTVVVADTERSFHANRRLALDRLRERLQQADDATGRDLVDARWRAHDQLVRGDPVRVERPR